MENIVAAAKLIEQLPQAMRRKTILALYDDYAKQEKEALTQLDAMEQHLAHFLGKNTLDLALEELDDRINVAASVLQQHTAVSRVSLFSAVKLLNEEADDPVSAFAAVLRDFAYPSFIPFAHSYPNTEHDSELKCEKPEERDIRELTSHWNGEHPYGEEIKRLRPAYEWLDAISLPCDDLEPDGKLNAVEQFALMQRSDETQCGDLQRRLIANSALTYVDSDAELARICGVLREHKTIAVDVEFSALHSYLGNTCLLEITDFDGNDYIVDLLRICDFDPLKEVFTDPAILKVFHGSSVNDFYWLQRDFRIFVVNLYDTAEIALHSGQRAKLQLLLRKYGIALNKEEQTSDWAIRPLSTEQLSYAREDSHWLIGLALAQRRQPKVDWIGIQARFSDIELFNAARRVEALNRSILDQAEVATSEDALRTALFNIFADVWCRFYDLPPHAYKPAPSDKTAVEALVKEEIIVKTNRGEFNSASAALDMPRKASRVITPCAMPDFLCRLGREVMNVETYNIDIGDIVTDSSETRGLQALFETLDRQDVHKDSNL